MEIAYLAESYSLENRGAELKKSCAISCMRIDERRKHKIGITLEKLAQYLFCVFHYVQEVFIPIRFQG